MLPSQLFLLPIAVMFFLILIDQVCLEGISAATAEALIESMYTGKIQVTALLLPQDTGNRPPLTTRYR